MIMTLISLLGGGLMRILPEVVTIFNKKQDMSHELAMLDRQIALENLQAGNRRQELNITGDFDEALAVLSVQQEAVKGQMQMTGMKVVDALNFLVRPLTTYYVLFIYGMAKVAMCMVATSSGISGWEAILEIYGQDDKAILSGILAFWFVGRVLDKRK